jgi:energy-coupling factor transporter ATP-binding protein EcfA2
LTESNEIIQLDNVSFRYEPEQDAVLKNVSISVYKGESILILGSSGAGKSTFLMTLAGFIPRIIPGHVEGSIRLRGVDSAKTKMVDFAHTVATVLQNPESQLTCLTVEDEIAFALENFKVPQSEIRSRVDEIITKTRMEELRDREVYALSGGQQQRLAISCALVREPEIVVLDEPISNLDPSGVKEISELIGALIINKDCSVIMTAHDFSAFSHLFKRVVIIDEGRIIKDGPIREVLADVPLFRKLGLELPYYVTWSYQALGDSMTHAPLSVEEAYEIVYKTKTMIPRIHSKPEQLYPKTTNKSVVLQVTNLRIAFGKSVVVKDVNFNVYAGEIVALLGFNGSGKSTLALSIAGAIRPNTGSIEVLGELLSFKKSKRSQMNTRVGYVFQYPEHQFIYESIIEEVMHGLDDSEVPRIKNELIQLGLKDSQRHPYELSGGEKRRLSVKSATIHEPEILILDEPTYGQDARYRAMIEEDLLNLNAKGKTIFIITHDMGLVDRIATRTLIMRQGELVYDGIPRHLFQNEELLSSYGLEMPLNHILFHHSDYHEKEA